MSIIVGVLTFMSKISTTSESYQQEINVIFSVFYFLSAVEISCSAESNMTFFNFSSMVSTVYKI